jgi:hypothetical protein
MNGPDPVRKGRLQLILIGAVFLGPLFLAWLIFDDRTGWEPGPGTQHGELLQPVPLLPDIALSEGPQEFPPGFRGKWSLIVFDAGDCGELCRQALDETLRIRLALGRDRDRVQRLLYVAIENPAFELPEELQNNLIVLEHGSSAGDALITAAGLDATVTTGDIFLADPLGNLIMRFPRNTGMKGIHEDLKKLLKISRIG